MPRERVPEELSANLPILSGAVHLPSPPPGKQVLPWPRERLAYGCDAPFIEVLRFVTEELRSRGWPRRASAGGWEFLTDVGSEQELLDDPSCYRNLVEGGNSDFEGEVDAWAVRLRRIDQGLWRTRYRTVFRFDFFKPEWDEVVGFRVRPGGSRIEATEAGQWGTGLTREVCEPLPFPVVQGVPCDEPGAPFAIGLRDRPPDIPRVLQELMDRHEWADRWVPPDGSLHFTYRGAEWVRPFLEDLAGLHGTELDVGVAYFGYLPHPYLGPEDAVWEALEG